MTSSWFFLSTLNYDARSTTHQKDISLLLIISGFVFVMDVTVLCEVINSGTWTAFLRVLSLTPVSAIPPIHHTHLHLHKSYRLYKEAKLGEVQVITLFQKSVLDRKVITVLFALQQQLHKSGFKVPASWPRGKGLQPVQNMQDL